jgi:hypothetical protein
MEKGTFDRHNLLLVSVLAGIALLVVLFWLSGMQILTAGYSYGDEGFVAEAARRIYRGEVPYRDFFNGVTPGSYYYYALLFKMIDPSFFVLRLGVLLNCVMILLGVWWVLRCFGLRTLAPYLMAATYLAYFAGPIWFIASYHWLVLALCLFSLVLLLTDENDGARYWKIAGAGGFATLAAFTMQHKGGLWLLAATVALFVLRRDERWRALLWFWGGILATTVPLVIGFVMVVGWDTLITDLILFPLQQYHKVESHRGALLEGLSNAWTTTQSSWLYRDRLVDWVRIFAWHVKYLGSLLVFLLPVLGSAALVSLWRSNVIHRQKFAVLTAFFVASYLGSLHRLADSTLVFAAPAALLVIVVWLHTPPAGGVDLASLQRFKRWAVKGWIVLFGTIVVSFSILGLLSQKVTTQTPAGPVDSYLAGEAETMDGVMAFMRDNYRSDDKVFCYPYLAMFYFLLQTDNPTPYDILSYPINTQQQLDHTEQLLEAGKVRWVLWNYNPLDKNSFGKYLMRNYEVKSRFKYVAILERR